MDEIKAGGLFFGGLRKHFLSGSVYSTDFVNTEFFRKIFHDFLTNNFFILIFAAHFKINLLLCNGILLTDIIEIQKRNCGISDITTNIEETKGEGMKVLPLDLPGGIYQIS